MECSSNADTSFSSLDPTSSKEEDLFSTSLISSTTSDVDIITKPAWEVADFTATHVYLPNPPCSSPKTYVSLPEKLQTCTKSKILPSSLLLSVTKKVRDGMVSKSEISPNELKARSTPSPGFHKVKDDTSSCKLLTQMSPPPVKSFINETPSTHFLDSNIISNVDCNISPLAFFVKAEVTGDVEDKLGSSVNSDVSICTIYSDDETRNKLRVERPIKEVPNYFISIQFSDPEIYGNLKEVHKSIMKKNGNCSLAAVPLHSLHMTLAVMRLDSEEDMTRARSALNRCGDDLRPKYRHKLLELPLQGLGNFRHSVVFAKVHPGEHVSSLEEIAAVVQRRFCEEGLVDNKHAFTPHVTVLKLSRVGKKLTKKTGLKKIYPDIYEEFVDSYFGTQKVHDLQLCSMLKAKDISGYYQVEHRIEFGVDDDDNTMMPVVNDGASKEDASPLNLAPQDSTTQQNHPEPTMSTNPKDVSQKNNIPTTCKKKVDFDSVIPKEALNTNDTYSYKSEMFIHITGHENNHTLHPEILPIFPEQTETNVIAEELTNIPQKPANDTNFSSVAINLPVNILPAPIDTCISDTKFTSVAMYFPTNLHLSDKQVSKNIPPSDGSVSDANFSSSVTINLFENVPPCDKPVSADFSSVEVNLSENLYSADKPVSKPVSGANLSENIPPTDKPMSGTNFSPVEVNLSENIPPNDKPMSGTNFSPVEVNLSENIPPTDKPMSDANFSSLEVNLSENIPPTDKPMSGTNFSPVEVNLSENIPPTDKPMSDANFSSVEVNPSENIPPNDKPMSGTNFSSLEVNLSENIPPNDKPMSDANFSSVEVNLSENIPPTDKLMSGANFSSLEVNLSENIPPTDKLMFGTNFSSVEVNLSENIPPSDKPMSGTNFSSLEVNLSENIPPTDKPMSDTNFSSLEVNLSENIPPTDKLMSGTNFSSVEVNLSENIPPSDKPMSDANFSSLEVNLSENIPPTDKPMSGTNFSTVEVNLSENIPPTDKPMSDTNFSSLEVNLSENIPPTDKLMFGTNFSSLEVNLSENIPPTDKPMSDTNFSSLEVNLSENIPPTDKPMSDTNFSSLEVNLSENIPPNDKPMSGTNFSSVEVNLSENIPPSDKPVSGANFSSVEVNLSENIPATDKLMSGANFSSVEVNLSENIPPTDKPMSGVNFSSLEVNLSENIPPTDKPMSGTNFSSVEVNLSENIPPNDKPMFGANFSSVKVNLSENIPPTDKPMSGANFSSVAVNLSENIPPCKSLPDNVSSVTIDLPASRLTSDKKLSDTNISSIGTNLQEDIAPLDQAVSDANFSSLTLNLSDNVPARQNIERKQSEEIFEKKISENNEPDLHDYSESSPGDAHLPETVSTMTDLYSNEVVPTRMLNQAESMVDESSVPDIINVSDNIPPNDKPVSGANFSSVEVNLSDNILPNDKPVSDTNFSPVYTAMVEETTPDSVFQISSPLDDLEFAEEATEGLSSGCDNPQANDLIRNETADDVCSIGSKTSDGTSLNTVPSMPKKRRKMEKCSVM